MNVLSLFDGISCARVALGDRVKTYYAAEIDKHAIQIAKKNYPDTIHVGDVRSITKETIPCEIDLLIGGSPCQDLSIAKKGRKGLDGDRSSLFWEYVRIRKELNPKWFVLENVASMPKKDRDIITAEMGVEPILINAALVSAQCRKRLFWTNIPNVGQPEDRGIVLRDILQPDVEMGTIGTFTATAQTGRNETKKLGYVGQHDHQGKRVYDENGKLPALNVAANSMVGTFVIGRDIGRRLDKEGTRKDDDKTLPIQRRIEMRTDDKSGTLTSVQKDNQVVNLQAQIIRKLTPIESERLQSLPDGYTEGICISQRYRCLGNAFNVEVVRHILNQIVS